MAHPVILARFTDSGRWISIDLVAGGAASLLAVADGDCLQSFSISALLIHYGIRVVSGKRKYSSLELRRAVYKL